MNLKTKDVQHTIEIRPNEFEVMSDANVKKMGTWQGSSTALVARSKAKRSTMNSSKQTLSNRSTST